MDALSMASSAFGALDIAKTRASSADALVKTSRVSTEANIAKIKATGENFEAVFLNSMFSQMMNGVQGEGPMGGSGATGVWRSFMTDEYAKSFAKSGGIGIGKQVADQLLKLQEIKS